MQQREVGRTKQFSTSSVRPAVVAASSSCVIDLLLPKAHRCGTVGPRAGAGVQEIALPVQGPVPHGVRDGCQSRPIGPPSVGQSRDDLREDHRTHRRARRAGDVMGYVGLGDRKAIKADELFCN
uniref:Uncharacterized protein n=1 Tax=Macrostomum lignano TaxID=282301 RepID=A0A1I8J3D8_9PLAT